ILALTKDEKLDSAICELIANSINAAERLNNSKVLKGYRAELYIGKNNNIPYDFLMKDNCGGISREDAKNKAFKLGNDFKNYKLGFGIGMKRALFKLCEEFILESHTVNDSFKIQMNILDWEKKRGWNIPIKNNNRKTKLEPGVIISVPKLNKDIEKELLSQQFKKKLINKIKLNYETKLEAGFEIYI
ncbi:ATP-binding protein, partial [Clostridium botulinum]